MPRLVRVVADDRALLMPVERLHRRVEVQHVVLRQDRRDAAQVLAPHPHEALLRVHLLHAAPDGVAGHQLLHPERLGRDAVARERVEVPEALRAVEYPQDRRADHVALLRAVRARVVERRTLDETVEQPSEPEERAEEHVMRVRRHLHAPVPAQLHAPAQRKQFLWPVRPAPGRLFRFRPVFGIILHVRSFRMSLSSTGHDTERADFCQPPAYAVCPPETRSPARWTPRFTNLVNCTFPSNP